MRQLTITIAPITCARSQPQIAAPNGQEREGQPTEGAPTDTDLEPSDTTSGPGGTLSGHCWEECADDFFGMAATFLAENM